MALRDESPDNATGGGTGASTKDPSSSGGHPSPFPNQQETPQQETPQQVTPHNNDDAPVGDDATLLPPSGKAISSGASALTLGSSAAAVAARAKMNADAILEPGTLLGGRYEIQEILGVGGMGAVYKAFDKDIDRTIALKVIRPDLAGNPDVVARFKQELLLARDVSHKNVIRIFDLRDSGGMKFITMEYVLGRDLRALLHERGKLPPAEALAIIRQVCAGLGAAHAEGVIHRDLKPSNILVDAHGRVVVMDFGLARTLAGDGMTSTGSLLGTIEYMSPEQAKASKLDARSDLFTVGLIFYELLTGQVPYKADSAVATLLKRSQESAVPIVEVDPTLPRSLSAIVSKCLERDPEQRFQSMQEVVAELDILEGRHPVSVFPGQQQAPAQVVLPAKPRSKMLWIGIAVAAVAVVAAGLWFVRSRGGAAVHPTVTVLLADFNNATSDPVFDGTVEAGFALAIEGAPFISAYNRGQARKIIAQMKPGATALDEASAKLVALREGISVVISGAIEKTDRGYKITCQAIDAATGKSMGNAETAASDKSEVLKVVGVLAAKMRGVLGDTTPESVKLATAETFTSNSIEAAHDYAVAQELRYAGKSDAAIQSFLSAIQRDPDFGSAYGGVAAMYANQGHRADATKYYKLAMQHVDRMTDREKYRTRGGFYLATMDPKRAIEEFSTLVQQYPADTMGRNSLAYAYYLNHDMARALEEGRHALETYPKNVPYRNNVALYAIYAGDFPTAEKEGRAALELNPQYLKGYISVALSALAQGHPDKAAESYHKLETVNALGASFAANGLADLALYQGDAGQAITVLNKGIEQDVKEKNNSAAAKKYTMLAEAQLLLGQTAQAVAALDKAVALNQEGVLFPAARIYVEAGQEKKALALAKLMEQQLEPVPQAYAKLIEGGVQLKHGNAREAIRSFQASQTISDTWLGRFDLARAYIAAESFTQADSELGVCLKRRGEATDIYWDEVQTFHYFPALYYYMGKVSEGLKSPGAGDAYRSFLALKSVDAKDRLVAEARLKVK